MSHSQKFRTASGWKAHLGNWGAYAAAAGASLTLATSADASTILHTVNLTESINPAANARSNVQNPFTLNGHKASLALFNRPSFHSTSSNYGRSGAARIVNGNGVSFFRTPGSFEPAHKYGLGAPIGVLGSLAAGATELRVGSGVPHGQFGPNSTGYVGFKTGSGDLGWLKIVISDSNSDGYPDQATIVEYAYNDVPGGAISAGEVNPTTPEPGTAALALLAAGAGGLLALRRKRRDGTSR